MTFEQLYSEAEKMASILDLSKFKDKREAYVVNITGASGGKICGVLNNGKMVVSRELPTGTKPSCSASVSMETIEKIMGGKLNPVTALMTGKIKVDGNIASVMMFKEFFIG